MTKRTHPIRVRETVAFAEARGCETLVTEHGPENHETIRVVVFGPTRTLVTEWSRNGGNAWKFAGHGHCAEGGFNFKGGIAVLERAIAEVAAR